MRLGKLHLWKNESKKIERYKKVKHWNITESTWKLICFDDENEKSMITMPLQTQKQKLIVKCARKLRRVLTFSKEKKMIMHNVYFLNNFVQQKWQWLIGQYS